MSLSNVLSPLSTVSSGSPDELGCCQVATLLLSMFLSAGESCGCVSQHKANYGGRWVPLLIRTVLAIINRCWQELKLRTNLSHFTVQQGQTQAERKREWLRAARQIHSLMLSGTIARTFIGAFVRFICPFGDALSALTLASLLCSLQSKQ